MEKKKYNGPLLLRIIRTLFPVVEKVFPGLAYSFGYWLFFKPFRFEMPEREKSIFNSAEKFKLKANQKVIQAYSWGEGPVVVFTHGWSGRASQFYKFIPAFVDAGYKVVAFDGPAHGNSQGNKTNIFEFEIVFWKLKDRFGEFEAMISHSFGGVASLFSINQGIDVGKVVNISTPTDGDKLIREFVSRINGSERVDENFKKRIKRRFCNRFNDFFGLYLSPHLPPLDLLMIHDTNDKEVDVDQAVELNRIFRNSSELLITQGLGHNRILRDDQVIARTLSFIQSEKELLPELKKHARQV